MTDDSRTTQPEASIHVNHWCCMPGCGEWGGFGHSKGRGQPQWWCWEHYPHKPNRERNEAAAIAEGLR